MNALETRGLTKYYGRQRGIIDVTLAVAEGEIFGFVGPNGAGKSTTIRTLMGLVFPMRGEARILGRDALHGDPEVRRKVGYLPSEVAHYDHMSARELLQYSARFFGAGRVDGRLSELAETFDLDLRRDIADMSSGTRKKVAILQSLLHEPRLLVLDEPTNGLDPLMQARFLEVVRQENARGVTVFLSSHDLGEVERVCRRVAIIRDGRVIEIAEIDALRRRHLSRVRVTFRDPVRAEELGIVGQVTVQPDGRSVEVMYAGEADALIGALGRRPVERLTIEEPSLEEIFLHYYGSGT